MSLTSLGQYVYSIKNLQGQQTSHQLSTPMEDHLTLYKDMENKNTYIINSSGFVSVELSLREIQPIVTVLQKLAALLKKANTYSIRKEILLFSNDPYHTQSNNRLLIFLDNTPTMIPTLKLHLTDRFSQYMYTTLFLDIARHHELTELFTFALPLHQEDKVSPTY